MPLLKANDPLPERPVVIGYYGEPGTRKTSIAHTAENPLLIDFDRGVARSYGRKDAILVEDWDEVLKYEREGLYKNYKTIIIDTAKAALDDFLMSYVVKQDFKMQKNKLQAYGAIGDAFKLFLNNRRQEGADVIIIAHAKKDEDTKKQLPDITGQSAALMLRVADQVGYVSMQNNHATISWNPTDTTVGKNTANLPVQTIPDKGDQKFKTFMADIIANVKAAIVQMSEAQREALEKSESLQGEVQNAETFEDLATIVNILFDQPEYIQKQIGKLIEDKADGMIADIKDVSTLNDALRLLLTRPLTLQKKTQTKMQAVQVAKGWKFDKANTRFYEPEPKPEPESNLFS